MAWTPRFLREIANRKLRPRFVLEYIPIPGYLPGGGLSRHSHAGWIGFPATISRAGSSVTAGRLDVGSWNQTTGSLTVGLTARIDPRRTLPRGALVRLRVGFPGWDEGEYEPVSIGQVQDIRWSQRDSLWVIECKSIVGALISRFTQETNETHLFHQLGSTVLDASYDSSASVSINLDSATGLEKLTGGSYLVRITPDAGDPFFLTGTTLVGTVLSGLSAGGQFQTTEADAAAGNIVEIMAYFEQDPIEMALTVITSTGDGTNGDYDIAPASWGLGLPVEYVDVEDCERTKDIVSAGIGTVWDVYNGLKQEDALGWLQSVLQPAGVWFGERQGLITIRAAQDVGDLTYEFASIYDSEIIDIRYSAWDPSRPAEYSQFNVSTLTNVSGGIFLNRHESRPVIEDYSIELPFITQNESNWLDRLRNRLTLWPTIVGESYDLVLTGWRLAYLCPGDSIIMSSRLLSMRTEVEGPSLVLSVQVDWFGATTTLRCVHMINAAEYS